MAYKSQKWKYSLDVITHHRMWQAIYYFIEMNIKHGGSRENFDRQWLMKKGQRRDFWTMVERNRNIDYWIGVVDEMFNDQWRLKTGQHVDIRHILDVSIRSKDSDKREMSTRSATDQRYEIKMETFRRCGIGIAIGKPNNKLDMYFDSSGLPKPDIIKKFNLDHDYIFLKTLERHGIQLILKK